MIITISVICQILTAITASISFIISSCVKLHNNTYKVAENVSVWYKGVELYISNQNSSTLYNVFVFFDLNIMECTLDEHLNNTENLKTDFFYYEVFPASEIIKERFQPNSASGGQHLIPAILFTDTKGNYWYRQASGKLTRLHHGYVEKLVHHAFVLGHVKA